MCDDTVQVEPQVEVIGPESCVKEGRTLAL